MTLVLVVRTIEGIVIVTDTLTTATTNLEIYGEEKPVEYPIYSRKKLSKIGNFAVVHAGLSFINGLTINQIVDRMPRQDMEIGACIDFIKETFSKELEQDKIVAQLPEEYLLISIGIIGYQDNHPFVYRLIFFKGKKGEPLLDIVENEDAFEPPRFGIDYFGDFEFVQMVIRAAKKENLLKPFDILTLNEALDLARTLIRFLIEFQQFMVQFTVAYPIESAVITLEDGFQWVDQMQLKKFHYDHED